MLHHSRDAVFRAGKRYTAPNAADEASFNEHFNGDVIEESKLTQTPPTRDESSKRQTEEPLDDDSPSDLPKPKPKKSRELAGLGISLGDGWKPPAKGSGRNPTAKDTLAESAQMAPEHEEFEEIVPINTAAVMSNNHDDGDWIDVQKSSKAWPESLLAE